MQTSTLALLALLAGCGQPAAEPSDPEEEPIFTAGADEELDALVDAALAYLENHVDPGLYGDIHDYQVLRVFVDDLQLGHVHLQQTLGGVPVFGGQIIVHLHDDGVVRALTDDLVAVGDLDTTPLYDADEAVEIAGPVLHEEPDAAADFVLQTDPVPELWVIRRDEQSHLAWSVQLVDLDAVEPSMERVFVDAHDGSEVLRYDNLQTTQINNSTRYDGTQTLEIYQTGNTKYLEDPVRDFLSIDFRGGSSSIYRITSTGSSFSDTTETQLHHGTTSVEDYYATVHGRDGIDGLGGPGFVNPVWSASLSLTGAAHFGFRYNNAFWDSVNLLFIAGDGDNFNFSPLVSVDVIGHEFTHGVTQFTAGLVYLDEPGALNESVSDVFGAATEAFADGAVTADTWDIGEDCWTPSISTDALRYMADPTADGDSRDHYDDRYVGAQDNGGVHWNSGIGNLAFYLVSEGGSHPTYGGTPISGIGISDAEAIWYRALTTYLTSYSDFQGMRVATILAAEDLFGISTPEVQVVEDAWEMVGVTPWVLQPGGGYTSGGVGAPSVVYRKPSGDLIMAFETQTGAATADCPNGVWGIGLATSTTGRDFTLVGGSAVIAPQAGTYRSCVAAHPTLMLDDTGDGLHLWFKAETDLTTCAGVVSCLYSGVGYAHVQSDLTTVDTLSSAPVVTTSQVMGYPSVVRAGSTYTMALQSYPDIYVATASAPDGPWTLDPTPVMSPGVTGYALDEVFNPALVCEGDTSLPAEPFTSYFGGRNTGGAPGPVLDGGVSRATSATATSWTLDTTTVYAFAGNEDWRHWSALRHGTGAVLYYSATVGGLNRIGVRSRVTDWSPDGLSSRTCPQPSWW